MVKDKDIKDYTYEESISELEAIIEKMDRGEVSLDESIKNFEEGVRLAAHCEKLLGSYERRITKIIKERTSISMEEDKETSFTEEDLEF